jgi:putative hydroxymethylpyrimidine transport system substrate-binding protein
VSTVRLVLEYFHAWTNDAGYQVAQAKRYYAAQGLDLRQVVIDPLFGDSLAHLVAGEADLAVAPTNRVFVRRDRGEPVVAVATVNHRAMETIQALAGTGIERPRDLAGRRVALNPTARGLALVRHVVAADGGDPDAVTVVDTGSREVVVDDLADGLADAFFGGYWAWDAMFGLLPPNRRVTWPVDTIGAPPYASYVLATTQDVLTRREPEIRAFLAATDLGFRDAAEDQAGAHQVLAQTVPFVHPNYLQRSLAALAPTWFHQGTWGAVREDLHAAYAAWLAGHGILSRADVWREAVTGELLPPQAPVPSVTADLSHAATAGEP